MAETAVPTPFAVAGIAGSLRAGSYNRALLRAARDLAPPVLRIEIHEIADIPLYNADVEQAGVPGPVANLRAVVRRSDALLIVTPEYNHGLPGVMKNAFDWLSRPSRESVLDGKLTAIMGASNGVIGTARSQLQLRQSLASTNTPTLLRPQVLVGRAQEKFDAEGRLTDEATRQFLVAFLDEFARWIKHMSATPSSGG